MRRAAAPRTRASACCEVKLRSRACAERRPATGSAPRQRPPAGLAKSRTAAPAGPLQSEPVHPPPGRRRNKEQLLQPATARRRSLYPARGCTSSRKYFVAAARPPFEQKTYLSCIIHEPRVGGTGHRVRVPAGGCGRRYRLVHNPGYPAGVCTLNRTTTRKPYIFLPQMELPAVGSRNGVADRQAEPVAARLGVARLVRPEERLQRAAARRSAGSADTHRTRPAGPRRQPSPTRPHLATRT